MNKTSLFTFIFTAAMLCGILSMLAKLTAAVADGNVTGVQFHPEKSGRVGLDILRAFCEMKG